MLFTLEGKGKLRRGTDYGMHSNQEVLDLYAETPPLETLMEVPLLVRRKWLFDCLNEGDIVIGKVAFKRPFGITVTLTMLEFGCKRDFTDLDIQAQCKITELNSSEMTREYKDPTDAYVVGDVVRGVITGVNPQEERVFVSLKQSRLPEEHKHLHLGVIDNQDTSIQRMWSDPEGLEFEEHLKRSKGFNNPRNIDTLIDVLGIDTHAPCSILRGFQRYDCPKEEYAEQLRRQQSAKWSMDTTAKGVEHFKAGSYDTALKHFKHALQIDGKNVEAMVAQGALFANQDQLTTAVKNFKDALEICPSHRNANKYLTATLVELGIQQEKEGLLREAMQTFREALGLDSNQQTAKEHLENLKQQLKLMEQKKSQAAARADKGLKSRFSHVRELILEEQSQARKKQKRKHRKKKTVKHQKKKKKKLRLKVGRHSKRSSSSSSQSSSESFSSESESSTQSSGSDEWVESTAIEKRTKVDRKKHKHSERHERFNQNVKESHVHTDRSKNDKYSHELYHWTDSDLKNVNKEPSLRQNQLKVEERERRKSPKPSKSPVSSSIDREKVKDDKELVESRSRKRKNSEQESYQQKSKVPLCLKSAHLSDMDGCASSNICENSITGILKRIREHSDKNNKLKETNVRETLHVGASPSYKSATVTDKGGRVGAPTSKREKNNIEKVEEGSARKVQNVTVAHFPDSTSGYRDAGSSSTSTKTKFLRAQNQHSEFMGDRKSSLVTYDTSSDEEQLVSYS